ncbi:MAG TPA: hypothetical protein VL863_01175, partial [bacterium]|nr:hypothetical protein [bacterium]
MQTNHLLVGKVPITQSQSEPSSNSLQAFLLSHISDVLFRRKFGRPGLAAKSSRLPFAKRVSRKPEFSQKPGKHINLRWRTCERRYFHAAVRSSRFDEPAKPTCCNRRPTMRAAVAVGDVSQFNPRTNPKAMTMQPLTPPSAPREISVTDVIEPAYERVKQMLFRPFNLSKWITIGFCAWLAGFGESGGGGFNGFNGGGGHHHGHHGQEVEEFRHFYQQAQDYLLMNIGWIVPLAAIVVLLALALWVTVLWLSCRGKFMFLHCVALDKAEVEVPWKKYAAPANSLFWFRLGLGVLGVVLLLPLLVFGAALVVKMLLQGEPNLPAVMLVAGLALGFIVLALGFSVIHKLLVDFVV